MPIFRNHLGQFHKMNTALVALTSLYAIGAVVALSLPYWASSYPVLPPLAAFAATPLGMGILATVSVALIVLPVYAISKNNKISGEKAPKLIVHDDQVMLLVTKDVYEEMKENNKNRNEDGEVEEGKCYIDFTLDGKDYRVIVGDESTQELGNTLLFTIDKDSLKAKDSNDKCTLDSLSEVQKKLREKEGTWVNTYLGELSSVTPVQEGEGKER